MSKGCIHCKKCKSIRNNCFCGNTKLTQKQLYNDKGYCSEFEDKETDFDNGITMALDLLEEMEDEQS